MYTVLAQRLECQNRLSCLLEASTNTIVNRSYESVVCFTPFRSRWINEGLSILGLVARRKLARMQSGSMLFFNLESWY